MAQYAQRVDESQFVVSAQLVPGLRGAAKPIASYQDPLTEQGLGPIEQINKGYKFVYTPARLKSFAPVQPVQDYFKNGKYVGGAEPYKYKARQIAEINTRSCI